MISLDTATAPVGAPIGSVVGVLAAHDTPDNPIACRWMLSADSNGFFAISGSNLVTNWQHAIPGGFYPVTVNAIAPEPGHFFTETANFVIEVR